MDNNAKIALAFAAGLLAGAVAGILFAPDKGSETRRKFAEKGKKMADDIKDKWSEAKAGFEKEFQ
ncbi:MAG: YtxH domain-containing protein [Chitinophagaceae bacterium]